MNIVIRFIENHCTRIARFDKNNMLHARVKMYLIVTGMYVTIVVLWYSTVTPDDNRRRSQYVRGLYYIMRLYNSAIGTAKGEKYIYFFCWMCGFFFFGITFYCILYVT